MDFISQNFDLELERKLYSTERFLTFHTKEFLNTVFNFDFIV